MVKTNLSTQPISLIDDEENESPENFGLFYFFKNETVGLSLRMIGVPKYIEKADPRKRDQQ